jgi:hypothetical protein
MCYVEGRVPAVRMSVYAVHNTCHCAMFSDFEENGHHLWYLRNCASIMGQVDHFLTPLVGASAELMKLWHRVMSV